MSTPTLENANERTSQIEGGKYLTFRLSQESYGISVLKVREIIRLTQITAVPQMPDYLKGVINLRGKVIPVVDLRLKFQISKAETTNHTCIIVVSLTSSAGINILMGLIVDSVEEVTRIEAGDIEPPPDFGAQLNTECILGMAKVKDQVKSLLDIDRVLIGDTEQIQERIKGD